MTILAFSDSLIDLYVIEVPNNVIVNKYGGDVKKFLDANDYYVSYFCIKDSEIDTLLVQIDKYCETIEESEHSNSELMDSKLNLLSNLESTAVPYQQLKPTTV